MSKPANWIRLECSECFRDDMDGVTEVELQAAIAAGWQNVHEWQSYEDAITTYDDPADEPPGYSVLDWSTHVGLCPECAREEEELFQGACRD